MRTGKLPLHHNNQNKKEIETGVGTNMEVMGSFEEENNDKKENVRILLPRRVISPEFWDAG